MNLEVGGRRESGGTATDLEDPHPGPRTTPAPGTTPHPTHCPREKR